MNHRWVWICHSVTSTLIRNCSEPILALLHYNNENILGFLAYTLCFLLTTSHNKVHNECTLTDHVVREKYVYEVNVAQFCIWELTRTGRKFANRIPAGFEPHSERHMLQIFAHFVLHTTLPPLLMLRCSCTNDRTNSHTREFYI